MPVIYGRQDAAAGLPQVDAAYCAETNLDEIIGTVSAMHTSSTIVMIMRVIVRIFMTKSFGSDDYCMLAAWFMDLAVFICWIGEKPYANGRHIACITPHGFRMHLKWQYYHSLFVMAGVVLVKISVALFLMRLVPPGKKWKRFLWAAIVFLICFMITCAGTLIWQCVPVRAAWDTKLRQQPGTRCWSTDTSTAIGLFNSSVNCITDFLFAFLPIPIIIKLQVNFRTKISLAVILSLGYVACSAGIVKAVKQYGFFKEKDPYWHNSFNVWNYIELCVGIIAASLPALKPLFVTLLTSTKSLVALYSPHNSHNRTPDTSGFTRHENDFNEQDVKLEDWTEAIRDSPMVDRPVVRPGAKINRKRSDLSTQREEDEWENIDFPTSQSRERLHSPTEIHKEVEIFSTSQPAARGD